MIQAICIKCGEEKLFAWHQCKSCGLKPELGTECHLKSMYQSMARAALGGSKEVVQSELVAAQAVIRAGGEPVYDLTQLAQLRELASDANNPNPAMFAAGLLHVVGIALMKGLPFGIALGLAIVAIRWLT